MKFSIFAINKLARQATNLYVPGPTIWIIRLSPSATLVPPWRWFYNNCSRFFGDIQNRNILQQNHPGHIPDFCNTVCRENLTSLFWKQNGNKKQNWLITSHLQQCYATGNTTNRNNFSRCGHWKSRNKSQQNPGNYPHHNILGPNLFLPEQNHQIITLSNHHIIKLSLHHES